MSQNIDLVVFGSMNQAKNSNSKQFQIILKFIEERSLAENINFSTTSFSS